MRYPVGERRNFGIALWLRLSDATALVSAGLLVARVWFGTVRYPVDIAAPRQFQYWEIALGTALLWFLVLAVEGLHDVERLTWRMGELSRVARALAMGVVLVVIATFALRTPGLSRAWLIATFVTAVVGVWLGRLVIRTVLASLRRHGKMRHPVLIAGTNAEAKRIVDVLQKAPETGLVPVGCIASNGDDVTHPNVPCVGDAEDLCEVVQRTGADTVIIASSAFDHDVIARMVADLRHDPVGVHVSSGLFEVLTSRVFVREIAGVPLITVQGVALTRSSFLIKRAFDIVVSLAIIIVGLPLWLVVMGAIKLTSPGPVFYVQDRIGRRGATFGMCKFRTMVDGAHAMRTDVEHANEADGPIFKMRDDPRVTRVGRWLRKFSIDEFPQLINVLKGEMSLVGPRPPLPSEVELYSDYHWRRMEVLPGMTGLWQVSGRSDLSFDEMVRLDLFYIENWSVGFDIALLARTLPAVLFARGAY